MTFPKNRIARVVKIAVFTAALGLTFMAIASAAGSRTQRDVAELADRYACLYADPGQESEKTQADKDHPAKSSNSDKGDRGKSALEEQLERISKRNVFALTKTGKAGFGAKLIGVLGEAAFFEGSADGVRVGQSVGGGKVTRIGPDWAEIEFKGKKQTLQVFDGGSAGPSGGPEPPGPGGRSGPTVMMKGTGPPSPPMPGPSVKPSRSFVLTPEMIEKFKSLSPQERQEALKHAPPEIREQLSKEL